MFRARRVSGKRWSLADYCGEASRTRPGRSRNPADATVFCGGPGCRDGVATASVCGCAVAECPRLYVSVARSCDTGRGPVRGLCLSVPDEGLRWCGRGRGRSIPASLALVCRTTFVMGGSTRRPSNSCGAQWRTGPGDRHGVVPVTTRMRSGRASSAHIRDRGDRAMGRPGCRAAPWLSAGAGRDSSRRPSARTVPPAWPKTADRHRGGDGVRGSAVRTGRRRVGWSWVSAVGCLPPGR